MALASAAYAGEAAPAVEGEIQRLQERIGRAPAVQEELQRLKDVVGRGSEELERQAQQLEEQRRALEIQRRRLEELEAQIYGAPQPRAQPAVYPALPPMRKRLRWGPRHAQAQPGEKPPAAGERPKDEKPRPEVAVIAERGGILTRRGTLVAEPSLRLSHSSRNRFTVQGVLTAGAVLIGIVSATDADRNSATAALAGRYGITDRLEVEAKVPYVYRDERVESRILATSTDETRNFDNLNIGDVEVAGHYQINRGRGGWPFFIGNLRVKSRTGEGPFDVEREFVGGLETESTTGSGFWAVEPSVTAILPSDPAVFFANIGYVVNIERDIDQVIIPADPIPTPPTVATSVGNVDPGDAVRGSFGFGFGINERASFSLGYTHTFIGKTVTEVIEPTETKIVESVELHIGAVLLGLSYRLSDDTSLHVNVEAGITEDAPDVTVTFRLPISFDLK